MRRLLAVLGILPLLAGCDPEVVMPGPITRSPPNLPPVGSYNLIGTVRDENDRPLRGAAVTLTSTLQNLQTTTDSLGRFEIRGISGSWTLIVRYANYVDAVSLLVITYDRSVEVRMVPIPKAVSFEVGKEFNLSVGPGDAPCDPVRWDANAPCARLRFQATRTGLLTVSVTWAGSEVDFTIMSDDGGYLAYSGSGEHTLKTSVGVTAGTYFMIWVHSYYGESTFKIRADISS